MWYRDTPARGNPTRRQFLLQSATAVAGLSVGPRLASGMGTPGTGMAHTTRLIPSTAAARRLAANAWLPDSPSSEQFQALALVAMDAAHQAGADFADIRIGVQRQCSTSSARIALGYGIRARVDGAWSFEHGTLLNRDALAASAHAAVTGARVGAKINAQLRLRAAEPFADVPVATGEWHVPVLVDPFTVPIDDLIRVQSLFTEPCRQLGFSGGWGELQWTQETRIFASTEGSLVTQSFTRGGPILGVSVGLPDNAGAVNLDVVRPDGESVGFETMLKTDYPDRLIAAAEEAIRWRELPLKRFDDVGRYPVVFDGAAFAAIVGGTLTLALDADRLSGHEADASGRSFVQPLSPHPTWRPPEFSSLLTVTSGRSLPSSTAVRWDDDGVVAVPYTLVDNGTVVDFHTTRETAPLFEAWYAQRHRPYQLHGGSVAPTPASLPMASGGDVRVAPSQTSMREAELYRDLKHGFLVKGAVVQPSPGLTTGLLQPRWAVEIVNGKPVARVADLQMGFTVAAVLRAGLVAVGDETTMGTSVTRTFKGMPWQPMIHPVTAPAAQCKEVDLLRMEMRQ